MHRVMRKTRNNVCILVIVAKRRVGHDMGIYTPLKKMGGGVTIMFDHNNKRTTGKEKDNKNSHNDLCVIGYLRHDYYELLSREDLLSEGRTFVTMLSRVNQCIHIMKI